MSIKRIGAVTVVAGALALPLAACGSSSAPTVTTVTATTTLTPCPPVGDPAWEKCFDAHSQQRRDAAKQTSTAAPAKSTSSGLPWWAWTLIVPGGAIGLLVLGFKALERNDDRTISRAKARVAELESRPRPVLDYDDYEDGDEDDELDDEDMEFLRKATDAVPTPAQPAAPAAGSLLSSLRNQGGAQ
ncbi:hypothetical protein [Mycobacteroides abscessus]|uniref:hypothetical protein n=1 Tax=Mycobacteroides abscessus TaxID=36809 RepID=UPI000C264CED|nr:hypothetical protein [Mycobacteroides abscessus]